MSIRVYCSTKEHCTMYTMHAFHCLIFHDFLNQFKCFLKNLRGDLGPRLLNHIYEFTLMIVLVLNSESANGMRYESEIITQVLVNTAQQLNMRKSIRCAARLNDNAPDSEISKTDSSPEQQF